MISATILRNSRGIKRCLDAYSDWYSTIKKNFMLLYEQHEPDFSAPTTAPTGHAIAVK